MSTLINLGSSVRTAYERLRDAPDEEEDDDEDALSESSMDDEQMMAIDEKLAAVFKTRAEERKKGKGSYINEKSNLVI